MAERLTIADVDVLMEVLDQPWVCPAGYVHQPLSVCFHPMPKARLEAMRRRAGLRKRLTDA